MKASEILLNTTEVQCSGVREQKVGNITQYCVLGLLGKEAGCCENPIDIFDCDALICDTYNLQREGEIECPECGVTGNFLIILTHLNNDFNANLFEEDNGHHSFTFKQIGKWLKKIGY